MAQKAYIDIVDFDGQEILDSKRNDIAYYTTFSDQKLLFTSGSNVLSKLCITSNNIGIGTVNPKVKLDIQSTDALQVPVGTIADRSNFSNFWSNGQIRYNTNTQQFEGYANNTWTTIGGAISGVIDNNNDTYISAEISPGTNNDQLQFYTSNINRMIINSNGYVGIGTTNPGEKLHIFDSAPMIRIQDSISSNIFATIDIFNSSNINGSIGYLGSSDLLINNIINGSLRLYTSNTERAVISQTGNIGIGTVNPLNKLHVIGDGQFTSNLIIGGITTLNSNLVISGSNTLTTGIGNVNISGIATLLSNLNVIGTTTLSNNLGVSGITTLSSNLNVTGVTTFSNNIILTSGNIGIGASSNQIPRSHEWQFHSRALEHERPTQLW